MKKTKLALMTVLSTFGISQAEYMVNIPLEHNIIIKDFEVAGDVHLTPTVINRGGSSFIVWNYKYGNEINIEGLGTYKDMVGQVLVSPTVSTEYSIVVKNGSKSKTEKLSLTVIQPTQKISFTADKYRIGYGNSTTLSWDVADATSVSIDNGVGSGLNESGASHVSPNTTTLYTLTAKGYEGINDSQKTVNIVVVPDSIINSFSVNTDKLTTGENAIFSWQVANAESLSLNPFGPLLSLESGSQSVLFETAGNFTYTLESVSLSGKKDSQNKTISVFAPAVISSFTVNGKRTVNIAPNTDLNFTWATTSSPTVTLNDTAVTGTSSSLKSGVAAGNTNYVLKATNGANKSISDTVVVTVIDNPVISGVTAPSNVFADAAFDMSWAGSNITNYKLKSNNGSSGVSTSDKDYGTGTSTSITPTAAGNYTYTITGTNEAESTTTSSKSVIAEADPTFTTFTVNGQSTINVSPSAALTFTGNGFSAGSVLQGRNTDNTSDSSLPSQASATAGTTIYNAVAQKSLNSVKRLSDVRSVSVNVINAATIGSITAPTNVFVNAPVSLTWNGTNVSNYKIKSNNANSGVATSDVDLDNATSTTVTPTGSGTYIYTITATNAAGVSTTKTATVIVESLPIFTGFTVNGMSTVTVSPSTSLTFAGAGFSTGATLQGRNSAGTANATLPTTASATAGTTTYYASATKTINGVTNYSAVRTVSVVVVNAPTVATVTAPTPVFEDTAFTLSWTGTNAVNYKIKSNNTASGIATSDVDMDTATSTSITPTAAGTYVYTVTATNAAGVTATKTTTVVVEALPTFTGFTVNGASTVTVAPSATLTFVGAGFSSGATLQGRNSAGTANAALPTTASATAGTTTYYASATKTVNGVINNSAVRSVSVVVVNAPTVATVTAPSPVFEDSAFTLSWTGTNATNYKLKSNNAASGIATTDVDMNTATSTSVTPTAAGTYTYTITATNEAGVTATKTATVVVEALPTFTGFTVNGTSTVTVAPSATLTFAGTGFSTGATLQGRNSAGTANAALPTTASATAGTTTYYASATKTVNGVANNSAVRSVSVVVVNAPTVATVTAPTTVFGNAAFNLSWTGTNATNYKIKSNNASSGLSITDVDMNTATSTTITPTVAGTYVYTVTATNSAGVTATKTATVVVEDLPTFTGFTVNGSATLTVAPSTALTFSGAGFSTGASLQGRNSAGTANATLPTTASATAGTTTYYAAATKTINGVTNNSAVRAVSVVVVNDPIVTTITSPTSVFEDSAFTMSWAGTNATNYKIKSNNAASGIATTDVDLNTATSRAITPTAAGTFIYTITVTNAAGATATKTATVVVEALPTFTGFTVNGAATVTVTPSSALSFAGAGFSTGASLQGRNSAGTANATLPTTASATAGTTTYYASAAKTINGVTNYSAVRSVSVKVENWVATISTYTAWANSGAVYNCSAWTPDASTVNVGTNFTQTRSCSQNQTRSRQDRQTETGTGAIRNNGVAVTENQTVTVGVSQTVAGTKAVAECQYSFGVGYQNYVWAMDRDDYGDYTIVIWNKQEVFSDPSVQHTSVNVGAYNYYMGSPMSVGAYQVCRKPL